MLRCSCHVTRESWGHIWISHIADDCGNVFADRHLLLIVTSSTVLLVSWAWWDGPLTWLINHHPSVLWHCWFGHLTRIIVSVMTYNVSSGTLNHTSYCGLGRTLVFDLSVYSELKFHNNNISNNNSNTILLAKHLRTLWNIMAILSILWTVI